MANSPDTFLSRSMMLLCMGTAAILAGISLFPPSWSPHAAGRWRPTNGQPPPRLGAVGPEAVRQPKLSPRALATRLVVDLDQRQVALVYQQKELASYPIAVGQEGWETPTGTFQVVKKIDHPDWVHPITHEVFPPGEGNPLGSRWIGFWADDQMEYGFHGTDEDDLIGQAVSHGCIRMKNRDIEAMYAQVAIGTPIVIQP